MKLIANIPYFIINLKSFNHIYAASGGKGYRA